jgi:hypothetical protein
MRGTRGVKIFIWRWLINFIPCPLYLREITPVPTEQKAGWATGSVWTSLEKIKNLLPLSLLESRILQPAAMSKHAYLKTIQWCHLYFILHIKVLNGERFTIYSKCIQTKTLPSYSYFMYSSMKLHLSAFNNFRVKTRGRSDICDLPIMRPSMPFVWRSKNITKLPL